MNDSGMPKTVLAPPGFWVSCTTVSIEVPAVERKRCSWTPDAVGALRRIRMELRTLAAVPLPPDDDKAVWDWVDGGYLQGRADLSTLNLYEVAFTIAGFTWVYRVEPAEVEGELHPSLLELPPGSTRRVLEA